MVKKQKHTKRIISAGILLLIIVMLFQGTFALGAKGYGTGNYLSAPPSGAALDSSFRTTGNATIDSTYPNTVVVTPDKARTYGAVWQKNKISLSTAFKCEVYIYQWHAAGCSIGIGDGLAFVMQNDPRGTDAKGTGGEGLNVYGTKNNEYIKNSIAIEFDTNSDCSSISNDPCRLLYNSHSAFVLPKGGRINVGDHLCTQFYRANSYWNRVSIEWKPSGSGSDFGGTLSYYFDNTCTTSSYTIKSVKSVFGSTDVWWGFTGATSLCASSVNAVAFKTIPQTNYPITVKYYKDSISTSNFLNQVSLAPAPVGTQINNVDLTLYAPSGYTTPGTRSGATVVAATENIVNVVYTKAVQKNTIYVYYYKDYVGSTLLGNVTLETTAPLGSPITGVDATLFAPAGYTTPGTVTGDTVVKSPYSIVNVTYTKPVVLTYPIYVYYYKDYVGGSFLGSDVIYTSAPLGSPITGVNTSLFAPAGYTTPGAVTGDTVVKSPYAIVNVTYTKPVVTTYPIYVYYYKDYVGNELLGTDLINTTAPLGSPITGVNTSLFAPAGYTTPGAVTGDSVVKSPYSIVYVTYTKAAPPPATIYAMYFKDNVGGELLGMDILESSLPDGSPLAGLIDAYKYAPTGYTTPGTLSGDSVVKRPYSVVYICYTKPTILYYSLG